MADQSQLPPLVGVAAKMLITKGLQMAAGNRGLMESIANKMASDESGNEVFVHKLSPGERAIWMQRVRSVIDGFTEQLK